MGSAYTQHLLELLAVVSSYPDEESAVDGAVERTAQALEAEVAAIVFGDEVAAAIGFPVGSVPWSELLAVARRKRTRLVVPGVGPCNVFVADWGGARPGTLILARHADDPFDAEDRALVNGMARLLDLTLTMLRTLKAEHRMRERSERHAAENAALLESLRQRGRLLESLVAIQRTISRRQPVSDVLEAIATTAHDLLGDDAVGLWRHDPADPQRICLSSSIGLGEIDVPRQLSVPLDEAGAAGLAVRTDSVAVCAGYEGASGLIRQLTSGRLYTSMAAPVHEGGAVSGSLLIASYRPRRYSRSDVQALRAFAEHVSLALADAKMVEQMHEAFHDSLTGLASRRLFLDRFGQQLRSGTRLALLFVDLDGFKAINDVFGHAVGDQLLMVVADRLRSQLRSTDTAGRVGGDEFAVMLCEVDTADEAMAIAKRIIRAMRIPIVVEGQELRVDASVGIALNAFDEQEPMELMRRADIAMYQAKRNGRGRCEVFVHEVSWPIEGVIPKAAT